jgi:hypothetical protein
MFLFVRSKPTQLLLEAQFEVLYRLPITYSSLFYVVQQPNLGLGCLIVEVSISQTIRHAHTHAHMHAQYCTSQREYAVFVIISSVPLM